MSHSATLFYPDSPRRLKELDLLRGIAMFLVILGHTRVPGEKYIMAFHMPLFFFITGITLALRPITSFKSFLITRWKRLIIPYFLFELTALALSMLLCWINHDPINIPHSLTDILLVRHSIGEAAHTGIIARFWFFPCLFFASLFVYPIIRFCNRTIVKILLTCMCFFIGFLSGRYLPESFPFTIHIALVASGFIMLGYLISIILVPFLKKRTLYLDILILLLGTSCLFFSAKMNSRTVQFFINDYGSYGWMLIGSVGGIALSVVIAKYLYLFSSSILKSFFYTIGFHSLALFPTHLLVLYFIEHLGITQWWILLLITLSMSIPIAILLRKYFPVFVGDFKKSYICMNS